MQIPYATLDKSNQHTVTTQSMYTDPKERKLSAGCRTQRGDGGYMLDISDVVMDNSICEGHGKTAEDVMQEASLQDVDLQRNYMAVMSNSMSGEDLARMYEEGFSPADTEVETAVTIMDRIKATLAQSGVNIAGYTDNIDKNVLEEIMGSAAGVQALLKEFSSADIPFTDENINGVRQAMNHLSQMGEISESTYKYMVLHHMEPTIDNFYLASHSTTEGKMRQSHGYYSNDVDGYYAKRAHEVHWDKLREQVEATVQSAGYEINDESMAYARDMIENGIPFTEQTYKRYLGLKNTVPSQDIAVTAKALAAAISSGKNAGDANYAKLLPIQEEAKNLYESVMSIEDTDVDAALLDSRELNLKMMMEMKGHIAKPVESEDGLKAKRCVEEIRLRMTVECNIRLLRQGFSIDTAPIEEVVSKLRMAEEEQMRSLFVNEDNETVKEHYQLYKESVTVTTQIAGLPMALVGRLSLDTQPTLRQAYQHGIRLQDSYTRAGEAYEALMTTPNRDMGDSIQTAFRNTYEILSDLKLEASEENCRAVRILAYNEMELSRDNLQKVAKMDQQLTGLIENMTPARVLQWIREGINPLQTDIRELEATLLSERYSVVTQSQNYADFLYRLENKSEISPEEKASYIGIYRLVRQIEKSDGAVIGTIARNGQELQFSTLLQAIRSNKSKGMDVRLAEDAAGVDCIKLNGSTITEQIFSAYTANNFSSLQITQQQREIYSDQKNIPQGVIDSLQMYHQPITPANIEVAREIENRSKKAFRLLTNRARTTEGVTERTSGKAGEQSALQTVEAATDRRLEESFLAIAKQFNDKETVSKLYEEVVHNAEEVIRQTMDTEDIAAIDLQALTTAYKQISLISKYADFKDYSIPIQIDGEWNVIRVKIRDGEGTSSGVSIQTYAEALGNVFVEISDSAQGLSGFMLYDNPVGKDVATELCAAFKEASVQAVFTAKITQKISSSVMKKSMESARSQDNTQSELQETGNENPVSTKQYYFVAKELIRAIQGSRTEEAQ